MYLPLAHCALSQATTAAQKSEIERLVAVKSSLAHDYEAQLRQREADAQETVQLLQQRLATAERSARDAAAKQHQAEAELIVLRQHAGSVVESGPVTEQSIMSATDLRASGVSMASGLMGASSGAAFAVQRVTALEKMLQARESENAKLKVWTIFFIFFYLMFRIRPQEELAASRTVSDRIRLVQQAATAADARASSLSVQLEGIVAFFGHIGPAHAFSHAHAQRYRDCSKRWLGYDKKPTTKPGR